MCVYGSCACTVGVAVCWLYLHVRLASSCCFLPRLVSCILARVAWRVMDASWRVLCDASWRVLCDASWRVLCDTSWRVLCDAFWRVLPGESGMHLGACWLASVGCISSFESCINMLHQYVASICHSSLASICSFSTFAHRQGGRQHAE